MQKGLPGFVETQDEQPFSYSYSKVDRACFPLFINEL